MSLYPSIEDLEDSHVNTLSDSFEELPPPAYRTYAPSAPSFSGYPEIPDMSHSSYTGDKQNNAVTRYSQGATLSCQHNSYTSNQLSSRAVSLSNVYQSTIIAHAIREIVLCKNAANEIGMRCHPYNCGIFVVLVKSNTPASMAGIRFGDQILSVNGVCVAGYSMSEVHKMLRRIPHGHSFKMAIRDRPFERVITLYKDSGGVVGFQFANGEITALIKDSSAARNGLLIHHQLLEINDRNVIGLKDAEIRSIIDSYDERIRVVVMPSNIYKQLMESLNTGILKSMNRTQVM